MKVKLLLISSLIALSACSEEHGDLQSWMSNTRKAAKSKIKPAEKPAPVERVTYFAPPTSGPNAFDVQRLKAAYPNGNVPDLNRTKEILENFSLENLKYVGSIGANGKLSAMINADGRVYTVRVGNRLGQNFGRVVAITPDLIKIVETVEDTSGKWIDRETELLKADAEAEISGTK